MRHGPTFRPKQARLSVRIDPSNPRHHLWCNHGTWWVHYTLETIDWRIRRVRRSLRTRELAVAVARRDELLSRVAAEGELVP